MSELEASRLDMEIELLSAMYPEQALFDSKARELKYSQDGALLQLRLPELYPESGLPDVIAANDASKSDLRSQAKATIKKLNLIEGEEALDAIIAAFQEMLEQEKDEHEQSSHGTIDSEVADTSKTVVIWLHHLLALTKRKLALSPTSLSGVTKPGYPGVMIFSGPSAAVIDHVNTLKAENWQAFQVRYEEDELWEFAHGTGIREVETMAELVKSIELTEGKAREGGNGAKQKSEFLKAVGIK